MNLSLSDDQQLLKDSVARFLRKEYGFPARRARADSEEGFSREIWGEFARLGWLAVPFAEEHGGLGGGPVETMVVMEEFGRALVVEPYLATVVLAGGLIAAAGSEVQKKDLLPMVGEGRLQLAFAHSEPQARYDLADVATVAAAGDGGHRLSGRKSVVFNAAAADRLVVSARTGGKRRDRDGISLFLVARDAPGVNVRAYRTVDGLRAADIQFEDAAAEALIGGEGDALPAIEAVVDRATAAVCAEAAGIMAALHEATLDYLKTRRQFGTAIGRFQALQHRAVDMFIACEEARSMAIMATLKLDAPAPERARAVSAAKAFIGAAGRRVGQEAVQLHGGMGMTDELVVSHWFKRLTMIDTLFGNADHHLDRFAATG